MRTTFEAISAFGPAQAAADNRSTYPGSGLGRSLATAAQIIRGDVGVEVITVDQGDWDMHTDMGTANGGWMKQQRRGPRALDRGVLRRPRHPGDKVTLVTLSEFGRRVVENDSNGTDHGYGNVMFVAGAGVRGGYHAAGRGWPTATTPTSRHHRLPPGARRHRLEAVRRLGRQGVPGPEVAAHRRHAVDPVGVRPRSVQAHRA